MSSLSQRIKNLADSIGINLIGFAEATEFQDYILSKSKRRDPKLSLPDAKSIIVVGIYIGGLALPSWNKPNVGRTSRLYLSGYFNDIVKQLEPIADLLRKDGYTAIICDDSENGESVIPLKLSAIRAGFGWQGKNSLLINKKYGTFLALGGILTNATLEYVTHEEVNRCKNCNRCQQFCPTNALEENYVLKINKCLSYLLLNNNFPEEAKVLTENRIIDCEICQQTCPCNSKHIKHPLNTKLTESFNNEAAKWEDLFLISNLIKLTETEYKDKLGCLNTEIPYRIFHRNILMVMEKNQKSGYL